jgi:hypothetical protein
MLCDEALHILEKGCPDAFPRKVGEGYPHPLLKKIRGEGGAPLPPPPPRAQKSRFRQRHNPDSPTETCSYICARTSNSLSPDTRERGGTPHPPGHWWGRVTPSGKISGRGEVPPPPPPPCRTKVQCRERDPLFLPATNPGKASREKYHAALVS